MNQSKSSVVVVGANFAGLSAAAQLAGHLDVCVIDPHPWFEFLPNIHELISGRKQPADLRLSKKELIRRHGHRLIQDRVVHIDPAARRLQTEQGREVSYDSCILAIGGVNNTGQVPGVDAHTFPFKSVTECAAIGERLRALVSRAKPFSVVIVGAGVEGIEALGEILRAYRHAPVTIHLVERNADFTLSSPEKIGQEIRQLCEAYPVHFHFGAAVVEVKKTGITLATGVEIASDITIWTGGVRVNPLLEAAGLVPEGASWAPVNACLQSTLWEDIFIVGDNIEVAGVTEKQGYYALAMGEIAGKNAANRALQQALLEYVPESLPSVYSFGDLSCFFTWKKWSLAGLPLASIKETIYQYNLAQMQHPTSPMDYADIGIRSVKGIWDVGMTYLTSPLSFFQQAKVRIL